MSKHNKVNKTNYDQAGRLTPDEMAREQARRIQLDDAKRRFTDRSRSVHRAEQGSSQARTARAEEE